MCSLTMESITFALEYHMEAINFQTLLTLMYENCNLHTKLITISGKMITEVANVIMSCAPMQITKHDKMPNVIFQLCYNQLEKINQFQAQVVESHKTLRDYLLQLNTCDREINRECAENTMNDTDITVKREPSEIQDSDVNWEEKSPENFNSSLKLINESEIKEETMYDNSQFPTGCADDTAITSSKGVDNEASWEESEIDITDTKVGFETGINWKETGNATCISTNAFKEEMPLKTEIKDEPISVLTEDVNASSNDGVSKISCENLSAVFGHASITDTVKTGDNSTQRSNFEKRKKYRCVFCDKYFTYLVYLNKHIRIHTGEKPYQCDICKKVFARLDNLSSHKRTHTGEKPYRCSICNMCFSYSGGLTNHKRTHNGEKPYACNICTKKFPRSDSLATHKRTHTGEKPYQCEICGKNFTRMDHLTVHKRVHTGVKPFKCDVCNRNFSDLRTSNRHKLVHTGEKPYQCNMCTKCFARSDELGVHKRTHPAWKLY